MDKQLELTKELRKARTWILVVGLLMFGFDMLRLHVVYADQLTSEAKRQFLIYDAVILAFFVGMWWFAKYKPVVACVLALCGFWALQIYVATINGTAIFQGILVKILFTLALIRGIKSANRAEQLKKELAEVFG